MKPEIGPKRVLLLATEAVFESEVMEALERQLQSERSATCVDLVYLDPTSPTDFFGSAGFACLHQAMRF